MIQPSHTVLVICELNLSDTLQSLLRIAALQTKNAIKFCEFTEMSKLSNLNAYVSLPVIFIVIRGEYETKTVHKHVFFHEK